VMGMNKRNFLKTAGIATLGVGAAPALNAFASGGVKGKAEEARPCWAMIIDMKKFNGDTSHVTKACNALHNVPHYDDHKYEINWIWTEKYPNVFDVPSHEARFIARETREEDFIILCNHCEHPPCVRVCPAQATFKRKQDGIVMMDYHRCIGCRFCMAACPYGSRSFNFFDPRKNLDPDKINKKFPTRMKGVVEKCNFCAERLAVGLDPACVVAAQDKYNGAPEDAPLVWGLINKPDDIGKLMEVTHKDEASAKEVIDMGKLLSERYTIKRRPELGTMPMVYYIV
jgi:[DsrC]-trisulfide reductase subunit O